MVISFTPGYLFIIVSLSPDAGSRKSIVLKPSPINVTPAGIFNVPGRVCIPAFAITGRSLPALSSNAFCNDSPGATIIELGGKFFVVVVFAPATYPTVLAFTIVLSLGDLCVAGDLKAVNTLLDAALLTESAALF